MKLPLTAILVAALAGQSSADTSPVNLTSSSTSASNYSADPSGRFGVGLMLGEPTGLSLKYFLTDSLAVDSGFGWGFHRETDPHLHADILWHKFDLFSVPDGQLPVYAGVGARIKFRDNQEDRVGLRLPIGVSYLLDDLPIDVFCEAGPVIDFAPSTRGGFTVGLGVRWWF